MWKMTLLVENFYANTKILLVENFSDQENIMACGTLLVFGKLSYQGKLLVFRKGLLWPKNNRVQSFKNEAI